MEKMFLYKDAKGNVYKLSEKKAASLGYKNKIGPAKDRRFMKDDESTPGRIMDLGSAKGESDQDEDSVPSDAGEGDQETQTPKPKKKSAKNKKREVESA